MSVNLIITMLSHIQKQIYKALLKNIILLCKYIKFGLRTF